MRVGGSVSVVMIVGSINQNKKEDSMGYYIQVPENKGKVHQLVELHGATLLNKRPEFDKVPSDKAIICVLDNGPFEAAGYAYSESEMSAFAYPDGRMKAWLLMDKALVHKLTGYRD